MAVEAKRGCGYRKVGGLYLVGSGQGIACDRLPIALEICPCCGQGIKQTRGWTWVDVDKLVGGPHLVESKHTLNKTSTGPAQVPCFCHPSCPLCHRPQDIGRAGLLWVGTQFYPSIEHFEAEARTLGVSRRLITVPRGFEIGKTWVLFAHPRGIIKATSELESKYVPAIFRVWQPTAIERIFKESDRESAEVTADRKRGITPVFVPDNDKDHQGTAYDKEEAAAKQDNQPPLF